MKTVFSTLILLGLMTMACNERKKESANHISIKPKPSLQGAWEIVSTVVYKNSVPQDTILFPPDSRSVKMFTKNNYIWTTLPKDSIEWHAFGSYRIVGDTLITNREYSSRSMNGHSSESRALIEITNESFSQTLLSPKGEKFYAEIYKRIDF